MSANITAAIEYLGKAREELDKASKSDDLGIELIELLDFVGGQLSVYQDAIADEARLGTPKRQRASKRKTRPIA